MRFDLETKHHLMRLKNDSCSNELQDSCEASKGSEQQCGSTDFTPDWVYACQPLGKADAHVMNKSISLSCAALWVTMTGYVELVQCEVTAPGLRVAAWLQDTVYLAFGVLGSTLLDNLGSPPAASLWL